MRLYTIHDVNRLKFIKRLRILGLSVKDIKTLMKHDAEAESRKDVIARTLKLLNMQKEKTRVEMIKLDNIQKEIESSIEKVEICAHCQIEPCREDCPCFGQAL